MEKSLFIIPECYVDTNLISILLNADVNHQKGCNNVTQVMKKDFAERFAVGIIDKDKKKPGYLDEFVSLSLNNHIELLKHKTRHHYLITIHPAIDQFILDCAKEVGVRMQDYGYPCKLKEFTDCTKKITSNKDEGFKRLFKALWNSMEMKSLRCTLQYLSDQKFNVDQKELLNIFASNNNIEND